MRAEGRRPAVKACVEEARAVRLAGGGQSYLIVRAGELSPTPRDVPNMTATLQVTKTDGRKEKQVRCSKGTTGAGLR